MLVGAAVGLVTVLLSFFKREKLRRLLLIALGGTVGFLWCFGYMQICFAEADVLHGQRLTLSVTAQEYPADWGSIYALGVSMTTPDGQVCQAQLRYQETDGEVTPGDIISGTFSIYDSRRLHQSEENLYEPSQGYTYVLYTNQPVSVTEGTGGWRYAHKELAHQAALLCDAVFGENSFFFRALILGDKTGIDNGLRVLFNRSGLAHMLVVSGMHIGFLVGLSRAFLRRRSRRMGAAVTGGILLLYMLVVGFSPSVVRAGLMWGMVLLAPSFGRERDSLTSLGLALLLTLAQNPFSIASVSLQLSYASALGIILFSSRLQAWMEKRHQRVKHAWVRRALNFVAASLSVSLAVQVFSMPLLALYFRQISLVFLVCNLLAVWAGSLAFSLGLGALVLGGLFLPAGQLLAAIPVLLGQWIMWVARWFGGLSFAAIPLYQMEFGLWFVFAYAVIMVCVFGRKRLAVRWTVPASSLTVLLMLCFFLRTLNQDNLRITVLDVGQGQSIFVQTGNFTTLIDCGGTSARSAAERAAYELWSAGETSLDLLVLTHYDADHAGGVSMLLEWLEIGAIALPDNHPDNPLRQEIETAATKSGTELLYIDDDLRLTTDSCAVTLYAPFSGTTSNDAGLCVLVTQGSYDMLVTGDITADIERRLIKYGDLPDVELLIAGHHGSRYSTGEELLTAVTPEWVAISAGADNSYGHPHEETLTRIIDAGAEMFRTDLSGDLIFTN